MLSRWFSRLPKIDDAAIVEIDRGVSFWENSFIRTFLITSSLFLLTSFCLLLFFIRPREAPVVLHYNVYFGVDLLGAWWQAYLLPLGGTLLLLAHLVLARFFYRQKDRIAAYLLLLATNFLLFGIALAVGSIAFVNY